MFCSKCGASINENNNFCTSCGKKINDVSAMSVNSSTKEIKGNFQPVQSKIPINIACDEFLIEQFSVAVVESSIAQGIMTLTNKRLLFNKDSAAASFVKGGGLVGMALRKAAKVPDEFLLNDIAKIEPTSCMQSKASFIITMRSGYAYKIAIQTMKIGKTNEMLEKRDRIVEIISSAL